MKCPRCGKDIAIPEPALNNIETYGGSALVSSSCCKVGVYVSRIVSYSYQINKGQETEDEFGNEIIPLKKQEIDEKEKRFLQEINERFLNRATMVTNTKAGDEFTISKKDWNEIIKYKNW